MGMRKIVRLSFFALAIGMLFAACHKDTQCKCVFTNLPGDGQVDAALRVIYTDGIDCEDITEMAEERHAFMEQFLEEWDRELGEK